MRVYIYTHIYISLSHLHYPFIQWALRLFLYLVYCEKCCNEHRGGYIFPSLCFCILQINTQKRKDKTDSNNTDFSTEILYPFLITSPKPKN